MDECYHTIEERTLDLLAKKGRASQAHVEEFQWSLPIELESLDFPEFYGLPNRCTSNGRYVEHPLQP